MKRYTFTDDPETHSSVRKRRKTIERRTKALDRGNEKDGRRYSKYGKP